MRCSPHVWQIAFSPTRGHCEARIGETRVLAQATCDFVKPQPSRSTDGILSFNVDLSPMAWRRRVSTSRKLGNRASNSCDCSNARSRNRAPSTPNRCASSPARKSAERRRKFVRLLRARRHGNPRALSSTGRERFRRSRDRVRGDGATARAAYRSSRAALREFCVFRRRSL